jgi:hypothetical protein
MKCSATTTTTATTTATTVAVRSRTSFSSADPRFPGRQLKEVPFQDGRALHSERGKVVVDVAVPVAVGVPAVVADVDQSDHDHDHGHGHDAWGLRAGMGWLTAGGKSWTVAAVTQSTRSFQHA